MSLRLPHIILLSLLLCGSAFSSAGELQKTAANLRMQNGCGGVLTPMRKLDLWEFPPEKIALYEFAIPGLHLLVEFSKDPTRMFDFEVRRFMLDYDPRSLPLISPYRAVLGRQALHYSENDLRHTGAAFVIDYGPTMEFYLRLPEDPQKLIDQGALLHVAMNTGHLYGYAAGTDVDGDLTRILRGSLRALRNFSSGLVTEARLAIYNRRAERAGEFFLQPAQNIKSLDEP